MPVGGVVSTLSFEHPVAAISLLEVQHDYLEQYMPYQTLAQYKWITSEPEVHIKITHFLSPVLHSVYNLHF